MDGFSATVSVLLIAEVLYLIIQQKFRRVHPDTLLWIGVSLLGISILRSAMIGFSSGIEEIPVGTTLGLLLVVTVNIACYYAGGWMRIYRDPKLRQASAKS